MHFVISFCFQFLEPYNQLEYETEFDCKAKVHALLPQIQLWMEPGALYQICEIYEILN